LARPHVSLVAINVTGGAGPAHSAQPNAIVHVWLKLRRKLLASSACFGGSSVVGA
jgi:hypothetical protein